MPRNVEIKARVEDLDALRRRVDSFADSGPLCLEQDDVFFHVDRGRLKLRSFSASEGELIYYERDDSPAPKESTYSISPTRDPDSLREVLGQALGVRGRVRKTRIVFFVGQTRVHLDRVEGLGEFLELEVVLEDGQSVENGRSIARDLLDRLQIDDSDLVATAYIDLLAV